MVATAAEVVVAGPGARTPLRLSWVGSCGGEGGAVLPLRMCDLPPQEALSHRQTVLQLCLPHSPSHRHTWNFQSFFCAIFHYCEFQKRPLPEPS